MRVQPKPMKAARRAAKLSKEPKPEPELTKTLEPTKKAKKTKKVKSKRQK